MKRCAYLTMDDLSAFVSDAELSIPPLAALGWRVESVSWRARDADWDAYDLVYIATPWDYQDDPNGFLEVLARIEESRALLVNPLALVRWNLDKRYLAELGERGVAIVPSLWFERWEDGLVERALDAFDTGRVVVKPQVGANADHTYVLGRDAPADGIAQSFVDRPLFVQPFAESIRSEGEYSLFYFGGDYSHAILKRPKAGDFRSQEEHGAEHAAVEPAADLRRLAGSALADLSPAPVYARADYVRGNDGGFWLMELELIEPSLYFRLDPESPRRFARALDAAHRTSAGV